MVGALPAGRRTVSLVVIFAVPFLISLFVCWLMIRLGPKDAPDGGRKTQAAPVPSSGGMGVLGGMLGGLGTLALMEAPAAEPLLAAPIAGIVAFTIFAALLGWADDVYAMPALTKLVALLVGAAVAVVFGPQPGALWIGGAGITLPLALGAIVAVVFIFVMSNAVNFIDGSNGIAMGTSLIILAVFALMLAPNAIYSSVDRSTGALAAMCLAAASALAGFLVWNLPGKLFAGDAGSLSVGGLIGGASVMFAIDGPVLVPLSLCLPILIDVFLTLAWRARHGRPLMKAHREHAYQLLLRAGWSHGKVARLWWGMTVICAGAVIAGPFASAVGLYGARNWPLDVIVFMALLIAGSGLWLRQRVTLGRKLLASGR